MTLWSEDKVTTELFWAGKFRGPQFEPIPFKLESQTVDTVKDSKGRLMPSVVALPVSDADAQAHLKQTIRDEDSVLVAMLNDPAASMSQIALSLGWVTTKTSQPRKSKVERAMKALKDEGLVTKQRKKWRLTKRGITAAEEIVSRDDRGFIP